VAKRVQTEHPLRTASKPTADPANRRLLRVVDLFSGCGGLSMGAEMAAQALGRRLDVRLAVDSEQTASDVYKANFPTARQVRSASVETMFEPWWEETLSELEANLAKKVGHVDVLMGGPPCQGHSNLNNHTRRNDPKNALYLYMVRAAQVFAPKAVLIENVSAVQHDTYNGANVVETARLQLKRMGYEVHDTVVSLLDLGVAQQRKRHILLATKHTFPAPADVFDTLSDNKSPRRDLRWAIGDLKRTSASGWDAAPKASPANLERMQYLLDENQFDLPNDRRPVCHQGKHSYVSMYGRLDWKKPAQTITSGFGSIGQGRYMHPEQTRALTAHEAARIQGFPDYFDFGLVTKRTELATMIGNAVPPQLSERIIRTLYTHKR